MSADINERNRFSLDELVRMDVNELVGSKPVILIINGHPIHVRSWTDASREFVKMLFANNELSQKDLPFCPDPGTRKAYVSNVPHHPDPEADHKFESIGDNVWVDVKYNAKSHAVKMHESLKKLGIVRKYAVEIQF